MLGSGIVLTIFNHRRGPEIFHTVPLDIWSENLEEICCSWMDNYSRRDFFAYESKDIYGISYMFELPSAWSRIQRDFFMISYVADKKISIVKETQIAEDFTRLVKRWRKKKNFFKAFYHGHPKYADKTEDIQDMKKILIKSLANFRIRIDSIINAHTAPTMLLR